MQVRDRFDNIRDLTAVTLMGWASCLASRNYRRHLARWIENGMALDEEPFDPAEHVGDGTSIFEQMGGTIINPERHPEWDACR